MLIQSVVYYFVANFLLIYFTYPYLLYLYEALQATSASCRVCTTLALRGYWKISFILLSSLLLKEWKFFF